MVFFVALLLCTETLPVFSGVRVAQSLVFSVLLCKSMFCDFSFDQCIICPSSVYGFTDYPFGIFTYSMCFALRITPLASLLMLCVLLYGLPIWYLYLCYVFCFTDYPFGIFTYAMCFALRITPLASLLILCVLLYGLPIWHLYLCYVFSHACINLHLLMEIFCWEELY